MRLLAKVVWSVLTAILVIAFWFPLVLIFGILVLLVLLDELHKYAWGLK